MNANPQAGVYAFQLRSHPRRSYVIAAAATAMCILLLLSLALLYNKTAWNEAPSTLGLILGGLVVGTTIVKLTAREAWRFLAGVFVAGFLLRVILAILFFYYLYFYYGYQGFEGNDDLFWDLQARTILEQGLSAITNLTYIGYSLLTAAAYMVGGQSGLSVRVINSLIGALIPVVTYSLARELWPQEPRIARYSALWLVLWPSQLVFSSLHQKDILLALVLTVATLASARVYQRGFSTSYVVLYLCSLVIATTTRGSGEIFIFIPAVVALVMRLREHRSKGRQALFMTVAVAMVLGTVLILSSQLGYGSSQERYFERAIAIEGRMEQLTEASGGINSLMYLLPSPIRVVIGSFVFLIAPFPPQLIWTQNFAVSLLSLGTPLWFFTVPFLLTAIVWSVRDTRERAVLIAVVPAVVVIVTNAFLLAGTIPRQRVMVEPLLVLLAVWVFTSLSPRRRGLYIATSVAVAVFAIGAYIVVRQIL